MARAAVDAVRVSDVAVVVEHAAADIAITPAIAVAFARGDGGHGPPDPERPAVGALNRRHRRRQTGAGVATLDAGRAHGQLLCAGCLLESGAGFEHDRSEAVGQRRRQRTHERHQHGTEPGGDECAGGHFSNSIM